MTYGSKLFVSLNQNHFAAFRTHGTDPSPGDLNPDGLCWDL